MRSETDAFPLVAWFQLLPNVIIQPGGNHQERRAANGKKPTLPHPGRYGAYQVGERLIIRGVVIQLEITLATFVIVTPAFVQTIIDSHPIENKHDCPYDK